MKLNTSDSSILIKVKRSSKIINYFINNNVYFKIKKEDNKYMYFVIKYYDYKSIKKKFKVKLVNYYGVKKLILFIKKEYILIISLFIGFMLLCILNNTCFGINIYTDDEILKKDLNKLLMENNIEKYKLKKSYKKISNVKEKIYEKFNDKIQWIEINQRGVFYDIYITKKIKNDIKKECNPQSVVASKDALVLSIVKEEGVTLKYINDYVKQGEVLISGEIINNSTLKGYTCASGKVYGEVWYTVNTTVPLNYIEYLSTGKVINHYYLDFKHFDFTLLGYYKSDMTFNNKEVLVDKFYLPFKLIKEKKEVFAYEEISLSKNDAQKEAIKRSDKAINSKLSKDEYIIDKKVLKISDFSSKINIEVFYKVYEDITNVISIEGENNEGRSN